MLVAGGVRRGRCPWGGGRKRSWWRRIRLPLHVSDGEDGKSTVSATYRSTLASPGVSVSCFGGSSPLTSPPPGWYGGVGYGGASRHRFSGKVNAASLTHDVAVRASCEDAQTAGMSVVPASRRCRRRQGDEAWRRRRRLFRRLGQRSLTTSAQLQCNSPKASSRASLRAPTVVLMIGGVCGCWWRKVL